MRIAGPASIGSVAAATSRGRRDDLRLRLRVGAGPTVTVCSRLISHEGRRVAVA